MSIQLIQETLAIFKAAHPEQTGSPNAPMLREALDLGATPQQAADQAWYFYSHAQRADGTTYTAFGVDAVYYYETKDHASPPSQGYGYGMTEGAFNVSFTVHLAPGETLDMRQRASIPGLTWEESLAIDPFLRMDSMAPPPGYTRDAGGRYVLLAPPGKPGWTGFTQRAGKVVELPGVIDANNRYWQPLDERYAIANANADAAPPTSRPDVLRQIKTLVDKALGASV